MRPKLRVVEYQGLVVETRWVWLLLRPLLEGDTLANECRVNGGGSIRNCAGAFIQSTRTTSKCSFTRAVREPPCAARS